MNNLLTNSKHEFTRHLSTTPKSFCSGNSTCSMLRSFNGPEPGGLGLTNKKVKERERGWYSLVYAENQLSPCTGLALFTKASGALSMGWRCRAPSREGLRSPGRNSELREPLCSRGWAWKRERGRERERKQDTGTKALMEQRCFYQHSVGIYTYTVLQGSYSQQR